MRKTIIAVVALSLMSALGYWGYFKYSKYLTDKRGEVLYRKGQEKPKYTKIVKFNEAELKKVYSTNRVQPD